MSTVAVIICAEDRFRVQDNGQVQRWTDSGWELFHRLTAEHVGIEAGETIEDEPQIGRAVIAAADELHYLYGWDISEVNVRMERDELETGVGEEISRSLNERGSLQTASVNYLGDQDIKFGQQHDE